MSPSDGTVPEDHRIGPRSRIPRTVIALGVVSLLTDAASEMIYPLLPLFVTALGAGAALLGVIEGVAESTSSLLKLASGILSDRSARRKPLVVGGYALSSLARPLIGLVGSAWQIALVRATDRVGKGIRTSPRDALIAGSVAPEIRGRAYGFHRAMDHTGAIIGPILCVGVVAALTSGAGMNDLAAVLRTTFLLSIVPGILAVTTLVVFVREEPSAERRPTAGAFTLGSFDGNFRRYLAAVTLFTLGNSSDAFLLYRVQESITGSASLAWLAGRLPGLDGVAERLAGAQASALIFLPLVWSFFHVVKAALSTPLGSLSDRLGRRRVIGAGWTIYAAVYAGFAALDAFPASWRAEATLGLFMIYAVYYAFTEGAEKALVADLVPPERRGGAFGAFHFAVGIAALPASVLFGLVYASYGAPAAFGMGAGIALLSTLFLAAAVTERPANPLTRSQNPGTHP